MSTDNPKRALYAEFATVAKALAHEHRLELLEFIAQGEPSVEILAARCGLSVANASQHLQHLRRAGLVTARRENKFVLYSLRMRRSSTPLPEFATPPSAMWRKWIASSAAIF